MRTPTLRRFARLSIPALVAGLVATCGCASGAHGEEGPARVAPAPDPAARLALDTDRVVVFKDGYGLFVKTARGRTDGNGLAYIDEVPDAAVLGSFWALPASGSPVTLRAEEIESREVGTRQVAATTVVDLLRANEGREVSLTLRSDEPPLTGSVVEVLDPEFDPEDVPLAAPGTLERPEDVVPAGTLVLVDTAAGNVVLPVSDIRRVTGNDLETRVERDTVRAEWRKRLVVETGTPNEDVEISVLYFRPGVRWIPTYRFDDGPSRGALRLQAEFLNEAEDIDGAEIDLVVGVPNFRFKDVVSPLVLERTLRRTLHEAAPQVMGQSNSLSNAIYTQRAGEFHGGGGGGTAGGGDVTMAGATTGEANANLYVYHAGELALDAGSRASIPLWEQEVARRDVYTADFDVTRQIRYNGSSGSYGMGSSFGGSTPTYGLESPLGLARNTVWHQLELENDSDTPWTTGAILLLADALPLAQELLTYTSPGTTTRVPVTVAVDVRATWEETQTGVERDALEVDDVEYTLIEREGTIALTNNRSDTITMQVSLDIGGEVTRASDKGTVRKTDHQPGDWSGQAWAGNPHSIVTWEVTLKPGASKTLEVESKVYVR